MMMMMMMMCVRVCARAHTVQRSKIKLYENLTLNTLN